MSTANIGIKLQLQGQEQVASALKSVEGSVDRLSGGLAKVGHYGAAFIGLQVGLGALAGGFVRSADAVTILNNQLRLATGSTQAAGQAYSALFDIAQRSRVSFTELGSTYASIARAGEALGLSQSRLLSVTEAIGNAMTVSGGSAAGMQAALMQLSQGLASGQLRGEELNSVMEQTPRLAKAIADGLGVTTGQLRAMGAAGQLSGEQVIKALEGQAAVLRGEVADATLTVGQAMTQLQNATVKTVGEFDKASGASAALASAVSSLAGSVSAVGKAFSDNEAAIQTTLGVLAGAATVAGLAKAATALAGVTAGVGGVAGAIGALRLVVASLNPVTLALLGLGAVAGGAAAYDNHWRGTAEGIKETIKQLQEANTLAAGNLERMQGRPEVIEAINKAIAQRSKNIGELTEKLRAMNAQSAAANAPTGSVMSGDAALARAQASERAGQQASAAKWATQYASATNKLNAELAEYRKQAGAFADPAIEVAIRAKFEGVKKLATATKDLSEADKARAQTLAEINKLIEQAQQDDAKTVASAIAAAVAAEEQLAHYGLLKSEIQALTLVRLEDARESAALAGEDVSNIQRRIDAQKRLIEATKGLEGKEAQAAAERAFKDAEAASTKAAEAAAAEWQKTADSINQSLTDALMRGFESGKDFGKNLKDTLVNMFKTMVLRPTISAILAPVAGGLSGAANAGQGGGMGGASDLTSMLSQVNSSVSNSVGAAFKNFATSSSGQSLGLGTGASAGPMGPVPASLTSSGQMLSTGLQVAGDMMAGYAMGSMARTLISNGYSAGKGMDNFQKVGIAVGSAIGGPVVGAIIGAGAGVFNQLFGRKLKDSGIEGTFGGQTGFEGNSFEFLKGGLFRSNKTNRSDLAPEVEKGLGDAFNGMRVQVGTFASALGLNTDQIAGFTDTIKLSLKGLSAEDANKKIQEALGASAEKLATQVLGATEFQRAGEEAGATLSRLATSLLTVNGVFDVLGKTALQASLASGDIASKLIDAFGGMDAFGQATSSYYEAFYSEQERTDTALRQLSETLGALGVALPDAAAQDALEQYRALVDAQDITTESGRAAYAALITLSSGFAQLVGSTQSLGQAAADAAQAAAQAAEDAAKKMRDAFNSAMSGLGTARFDLENRLLTLDGNNSEVARRVRERDLAGLTEGLDTDSAAQIAAAYDLNTALREQIAAQEAAAAAAQAAAQAGQQAAQQQQQAAEQIKQAWQSVADSLLGEIQRIRGVLTTDSGAGFAAAQSQFAITTAQARAGDQEAAKALPGLSQTMLTLAEASATTLAELQRYRAQTAGSLEQTTRLLAGQFALDLPGFAVGTNYVPKDMVARIHEGEAIVPRAYNPAAGGQANSAEIVSELRALRTENQTQAGEIARLNLRVAKVLERWDIDGMPELREVAA